MSDPLAPKKVNELLKPHEECVSDWETAVAVIDRVIAKSQSVRARKLVWRGLTDANFWPDNSLYRLLLEKAGSELDPTKRHAPFEVDMQSYEDSMLSVARRQWRFDHLPALEIFAHIRHYGGATRLLDVTYNPLIALWFAVERQLDEFGNEIEDVDARLFAFDVSEKEALLDNDWGGREIPWDSESSLRTRSPNQNESYWIWKPPSYNERIPAQNSAFLVSKVPTIDQLLWNYSTNKEFLDQISLVPSLVAEAKSIAQEFAILCIDIEVRARMHQAREIIRRQTIVFEKLNATASQLDVLIMELLHLERLETGGKFYPQRFDLNSKVEALKGVSGYSTGEAREFAEEYDEYVSLAPEEDLRELMDYDLKMVEEFVADLSWFEDQVTEMRDYITRDDDEIGPSSIAMKFGSLADAEDPGPFTTYTIRISAGAKKEIRAKLELNYGYNASTLYPDLMGLALKGKDFF